MLAVAALLTAGALFLVALAILVYVGYRFLSLALSFDQALLLEFRSRSATVAGVPVTQESLLGSQLKQFIADRMKPTDGEFIANSDEELYIQEQIKNLRDQGSGGLTDEELKSFISQAVTEKG